MYMDRSLCTAIDPSCTGIDRWCTGINARRGAHCRDRFKGGCPLSNLAWSKVVVGGIG